MAQFERGRNGGLQADAGRVKDWGRFLLYVKLLKSVHGKTKNPHFSARVGDVALWR
jgi:hypothetical protein